MTAEPRRLSLEEIADLVQATAALHNHVCTPDAALLEQRNRAEDRVAALEARVDNDREAVRALVARVSGLEAQNAELENLVILHRQQIEGQERSMASQITALDTLFPKVRALEAQVAAGEALAIAAHEAHGIADMSDGEAVDWADRLLAALERWRTASGGGEAGS